MTKAVKKESKTEKPRMTQQHILEEAARFVGEITGKYTLCIDSLSKIAKAINAVAEID